MTKTKLEIINIVAGISEYVSYEKQLLLDAEKYIKRAEMYLAIGKSRHCLGCLIKAARKYDKAQSHMLAMDGLGQALMQPMINAMNDAIAYGIGLHMDGKRINPSDILNLKA